MFDSLELPATPASACVHVAPESVEFANQTPPAANRWLPAVEEATDCQDCKLLLSRSVQAPPEFDET